MWLSVVKNKLSNNNLRQYLRQPGFTCSACRSFSKSKERVQKFKETGDSQFQNELDKVCFQHNMAYGYFKNLSRRTASDTILRDKAFNIAKNPKYDGYQCRLASMVYNFFDKETSSGFVKNKNMLNQESAKELHKPIIKFYR